MRITEEAIAELIEHGGQLFVGPISEIGVLRLALDLRDARNRIIVLEAEERSRRQPWGEDRNG